jgi:EAL domain-containing protein (putative c-di-GMP-specific phosphodiesterase class I)
MNQPHTAAAPEGLSHAENSQRLARIGQALEKAIDEGALILHYQPQIELDTQEMVGLEALCRWHMPSLGIIPPDEFIPVAEETGLIVPIGRGVLKQIQADLPALLARYPQLRVGVNFSMRELAEPDFFPFFQSWLQGLPPQAGQHLDIEVTETAFKDVPPRVVDGLNALREQGVRVAIDDFGAGQSGLARLHTLPFDVLKLDKQFVQSLDHPMVREIIQSVVRFTHKFDKGLVAEGVETPAQREALQAMGCRVVQGYLFSEPKPLAHWLSA